VPKFSTIALCFDVPSPFVHDRTLRAPFPMHSPRRACLNLFTPYGQLAIPQGSRGWLLPYLRDDLAAQRLRWPAPHARRRSGNPFTDLDPQPSLLTREEYGLPGRAAALRAATRSLALSHSEGENRVVAHIPHRRIQRWIALGGFCAHRPTRERPT